MYVDLYVARKENKLNQKELANELDPQCYL